jgi:cation diffusion facilitator CzcD-associated flavoprotein CzcO
VHVSRADGGQEKLTARAVIDASGTWTSPNPAGADGLPALGEKNAMRAGLVSYLPPTPKQTRELAGKHVVIVGSGLSAMTAVIQLADVGGGGSGYAPVLGGAPRRVRGVVRWRHG